MRAASRGQTKRSNRRSDRIVGISDDTDGQDASFGDFQEALRRQVRHLWPQGTTAALVKYGLEERSAQRFLARQGDMPFEVFWRLLCCPENGSKFHTSQMVSVGNQWAKDVLEGERIVRAQREVRDNQQILDAFFKRPA